MDRPSPDEEEVELVGCSEAIESRDPFARIGGLALDFVSKMVASSLSMFLALDGQSDYQLIAVRTEPILGLSPKEVGETYLRCRADHDPFAEIVNNCSRGNLIDGAQLEEVSGFNSCAVKEDFLEGLELGSLLLLAMCDQGGGDRLFVLLARTRDETEFTEREKNFFRHMAPLLTQSCHCARELGGLRTPPPEALDGKLTSRELEVALLAANGARNSEIAEELHIALSTTKTHLHNVYAKLGVKSRVQLALLVGEPQGTELDL